MPVRCMTSRQRSSAHSGSIMRMRRSLVKAAHGWIRALHGRWAKPLRVNRTVGEPSSWTPREPAQPGSGIVLRANAVLQKAAVGGGQRAVALRCETRRIGERPRAGGQSCRTPALDGQADAGRAHSRRVERASETPCQPSRMACGFLAPQLNPNLFQKTGAIPEAPAGAWCRFSLGWESSRRRCQNSQRFRPQARSGGTAEALPMHFACDPINIHIVCICLFVYRFVNVCSGLCQKKLDRQRDTQQASPDFYRSSRSFSRPC